jgi:hypothetical protein
MSPIDLLHAHLGNAVNPTNPEIYADDVFIEFPYAPKHHTQKLEGAEAIFRFFTNIGLYFEGYALTEATIYETSDPNVIVAEYGGSSTSKETGLPYRQRYVSFLTARDGKIAHIREYYNPVHVLVAGGEIEEPGG